MLSRIHIDECSPKVVHVHQFYVVCVLNSDTKRSRLLLGGAAKASFDSGGGFGGFGGGFGSKSTPVTNGDDDWGDGAATKSSGGFGDSNNNGFGGFGKSNGESSCKSR